MTSESVADSKLPSPPVRSRPSSHHRRRSSVSTRRESAEVMGVALPQDEPDDTDRDKIISRALRALEGRMQPSPRNSFVNGFTKVEIPDLDAMVASDNKPDAPRPSSLLGPSSIGLTKRDSFGRLLVPSSASGQELHTLHEEEEEDEDDRDVYVYKTGAVKESSPVTPVPRHRPATLNLKPLALAAQYLPTPSPTPSPHTGLKSLALASSSSPFAPSPVPPAASRRQSTALTVNKESKPATRGSILYKRSSEPFSSVQPRRITEPTEPLQPALITPEDSIVSTPTTPALSISGHRSVSSTERAFIYQSHATLMGRISELERALSHRNSVSSDSQRAQSPPPSPLPAPSTTDEFLDVISDLKLERDELRRDVQTWRGRVASLEKQVTLLTRRVENERKEAWTSKERLGVLTIEKGILEEERSLLKTQVTQLREEVAQLRDDVERERQGRALELENLMKTPRPDKTASSTFPGVLDDATPRRPKGHPVQSIDSFATCADVEDVGVIPFAMNFRSTRGLKSVDETPESTDDVQSIPDEDIDDELAHYQDEGSEYAESISSRSSSFCSLERPVPPRPTFLVEDLSVQVQPISRPKRNSLTSGWTFPRGKSIAAKQKENTVDRFFVCLDDLDVPEDSTPLPSPTPAGAKAHGFGFGVEDDDDDMPPFVLPSQPSAAFSERATSSQNLRSESPEPFDPFAISGSAPLVIKSTTPKEPISPSFSFPQMKREPLRDLPGANTQSRFGGQVAFPLLSPAKQSLPTPLSPLDPSVVSPKDIDACTVTKPQTSSRATENKPPARSATGPAVLPKQKPVLKPLTLLAKASALVPSPRSPKHASRRSSISFPLPAVDSPAPLSPAPSTPGKSPTMAFFSNLIPNNWSPRQSSISRTRKLSESDSFGLSEERADSASPTWPRRESKMRSLISKERLQRLRDESGLRSWTSSPVDYPAAR